MLPEFLNFHSEQVSSFVGYLAGALIAVTMIPQIIQSVRTKDVEGISKSMLLIFFLSMLLWTFYGVLIQSGPLMITNGTATMVSGIQVFIKFKYAKK